MLEFKAPLRDWERDDDWFSWPKPLLVLRNFNLLVSKYEILFPQKIYLPAAVIGFTPTLHLSLPNIDVPQRLSLIAIFVIFAPNGGKPCDGNKEPVNSFD